MKRSKLNKFSGIDLFVYLTCIFVLAVIIFPVLHVVAVSLSGSLAVMQDKVGLFPVDFNLEAYKNVLSDSRIFTAYGNTVFYTLVGTAMSLIVTAMGAYALSANRMVGYKFFSMMIVITMFFGGGMIPNYLTVKAYKILNTRWAVLLPGLVNTWNFLVMRSFFDSYPKEIEESGKLDGLTDAGVFFRLVLPTSKAVLATIGLYYAVAIWNSYLIPSLYLDDAAMYPLQVILRSMLTTGMEQGGQVGDTYVVQTSLKYATIVVAVLPIICVYPFLQKYFVKGTMIGAVKG